jgi:hypothetical protein
MWIETMRGKFSKTESEFFLFYLTRLWFFDNRHGPFKNSRRAQAATGLVELYMPLN